jgi:protein-tyrosine phosphatase
MFRLSRIVLAALTVLPAIAYADITHLQCVQTGPTEYRLSYELTGGSHSVEIFDTPDAQGSAHPQTLLKTSDTTVTVHAGKPDQRMYFFVKPNDGEEREVSIRHLQLQGTPNFRDLGGYETADGRFTRWGLIYRSGVLTYLTPDDYTYLSQLHIHVICDFRTQQENAVAPETWIPGADVDHLHYPIGSSGKKSDATVGALLAGNPTPEQLRTRMIAVYSGMAFKGAPQLAKLFAAMETGPLPVLYHCTAGKDRTGMFSAFLLLTLGVPEKTVLADYALTNVYLKQGGAKAMQKMEHASADSTLAQLTPEDRAVLMAADPTYMQQTLKDIDAKYGSFDAYRREALHVTDADAEVLKRRLLTDR